MDGFIFKSNRKGNIKREPSPFLAKCLFYDEAIDGKEK